MKKTLIAIMLMLGCYAYATNYTVTSATSKAAVQSAISGLVAGDTLFVSGTLNMSGLIHSANGTLANKIVIKGINNAKISAFKTLTSPTNMGGNIWKFENASTLDSINIVLVNGVNTHVGIYPNNYHYWVSIYDYDYGTFDRFIVSGVGNVDTVARYNTVKVTGGGLVHNTVDSSLIDGKLYFKSFGAYGSLIKVSGLDNSIDVTGAKIFSRLTFAPPISYVEYHNGDTIIRDRNTYSQSVANQAMIFFMNKLEFLDVQNEWYYDKVTGDFYIYSTTEPTGVQIPEANTILTVNGNYVVIDDIDFEGANTTALWNNYFASGKLFCEVKNCSITYCGLNAIELRYSPMRAMNNYVANCNSQGISVPFSNTLYIYNNYIENIGLLMGMVQHRGISTGIYQTASEGDLSIIRRNTIKRTGYAGIITAPDYSYATDMLIDSNIVDSACINLNDGGAIYTYTGINENEWGSYTVKHNIVSNTREGEGMSGIYPRAESHGIYNDNYTSNSLITDNIIINSSGFNIYVNNPENSIWRNNVLFSNPYKIHTTAYQLHGGLRLNGSTSEHPENVIFNKNITVQLLDSQRVYRDYWNLADYPQTEIDSNIYIFPNSATVKPFHINLSGAATGKTFAEWQTYSGMDDNSTFTEFSTAPTLEYNATMSPKTINFSGYKKTDAYGNEYDNNITLEPFTSVVFVSSEALPEPPAPVAKPKAKYIKGIDGKVLRGMDNKIITTLK